MTITLTVTGETGDEIIKQVMTFAALGQRDQEPVSAGTPMQAVERAMHQEVEQGVFTGEEQRITGTGTTNFLTGGIQESEVFEMPKMPEIPELLKREAPLKENFEQPIGQISEKVFRQLGKAPEGRTRRTKEEIAEDDLILSLAKEAEQTGLSFASIEDAVAKRGHKVAAASLREYIGSRRVTQPNISASPENRRNLDDPQDSVDEAIEDEANRNPDAPLTVDDLRVAMQGYVDKHGMAKAQAKGPQIFVNALGAPPEGEDFWKLSLFHNVDQFVLCRAVEAWQKAVG